MNNIYTGSFTRVREDLYIYAGAVNCAVFVREGAALIIDACDSLTSELLNGIGVSRVELILLTQYRRPHLAGAYGLAGAEIIAPEAERALIEHPKDYWANEKNGRYLVDFRPYHLTPAAPLSVARGVNDGDEILWRGFKFTAVSTPGPTDGSMSYVADVGGRRLAFCGGLILSGGRVPELYSMQIKDVVSCGYHGFFGARDMVLGSAEKLCAMDIDMTIPALGGPISDLAGAVREYRAKAEALMANYVSVSAMNYYFPELFASRDVRMPPSPALPLPGCVIRCGPISFMLVSESGGAIMFDCYGEKNIEAARAFIAVGRIKSVEHLFLTHYHYDHIERAGELAAEFGCDVWATGYQADVLRHPRDYLLTCSVDEGIDVTELQDMRPFVWQEFTLTPMNFPGQTLYGDALLVEGRGIPNLLFVGDSFAPTGLDDYCAGNRNFIREGAGMNACLDIVAGIPSPVMLINQHQDEMFSFSPEQIEYMKGALAERRTLIEDITFEEVSDLATDEWWLRAHPFRNTAVAGGRASVSLMVTNHLPGELVITAQAVLPEGWPGVEKIVRLTVPPLTSGFAEGGENPDGALKFDIDIPEDAAPGRTIIPFRISANGRYLGQFRCAVIDIT